MHEILVENTSKLCASHPVIHVPLSADYLWIVRWDMSFQEGRESRTNKNVQIQIAKDGNFLKVMG